MTRAALLLGRADHPNVVALQEELPRHGVEPRVLDPRGFPARATLSVHLDKAKRPALRTTLADVDDVKVGWFSSHESVRVSSRVARPARPFARAAAVAGLVSLRQAHSVPWVNDPWRAARAGDKVWQLVVARRRGFAVPETLLTNDPDAFRAFVRRRKRVAVKSPSGSAGLPDDRRVLTHLVTPRDLADADAVAHAPVLAQEYVEKRTEVRATVVGGRVFACEIHSQATPRTRVDWRRYDARTPHGRLDLPAAVRRRCVQVARDLGLDYSGIDLVRTPRDEYVFLEANSEPAWLWVEDKTGLPITRALARLLAARAAAKAHDREASLRSS
jgi:glutathione synthase/RimK-type ligase-like ATP-grasp enzyme